MSSESGTAGGPSAATLEGSWNRFWFTPSDARHLAILRIGIGLLAVCYVLSHTADLQLWFGPEGVLSGDTAAELQVPAVDDSPEFRWSYLDLARDATTLWILHVCGLLVTTCLLFGIGTRAASIASCVVVLAYVHRAPMLTGMWEPVLTPLLLYLCLGPAGRFWSFDAWWKSRRRAQASERQRTAVAATVSIRLMQVHLVLITLTMGLVKVAGDTWWVGEAMWWVVARPDSRVVDLTWVGNSILWVNLWTHAIVVFELSFGVLVWFRQVRPIVLGAAWIAWSSLALATGELACYATLAVASLAFVSTTGKRPGPNPLV